MTKEIFDNENISLEGYGSDNISNGKGIRKKEHFKNNSVKLENEKDQNIIQNLKIENPNLSFEQWSNTLKEKRQNLDNKINEYFPEISLELDFILSIKTILNVFDICLPYMGIVFAVPSSLKTEVIELLRKWIYSYFIDKFTAKSFVSHSATVAKEKLSEIDLLPRIKNKVLLTPELAPLFSGKEEDIKDQFGIITRLLDGKGLATESGVHGNRGYYGQYMFTWIGAAVDIPHNIYKFLSTIGFKIYFLRLPRTEISEDDLVEQTTAGKPFNDKIREIEKLLIDYLNWFEICPISIGLENLVKIEWDKSQDDKNAIRIIARLAILLAHLRGNIFVYKSSDLDDLVIPINNIHNNNTINTNTGVNYSEGFIHSLPTIENPSRANRQLYNLARGRALAHGRNYITMDDIPLVIKVVLSTGSIERVLVLDFLIANKGSLTTSQITTSMRIANNTAKRTMTEFKGLELVTMERTSIENSNSEYKITLNPKFNWFLTDEFKKLRDNFKPADNKDYLKSQKKSNPNSDLTTDNNTTQNNNGNESQFCYDENTPCVTQKIDIENNNNYNISYKSSININENSEKTKDNDSHRGEISHSKTTKINQQQPHVFSGKDLKFNNPLISVYDLDTGYAYQPEIINNISRVKETDHWFCENCNIKGDKGFMMKHLCKNNKNKNNFNNTKFNRQNFLNGYQ